MTKEELAAKLNGREIGNEMTRAESKQAKADGLVVVYGASDDLMEFEGAIYDEVSAYEGGEAFVTSAGLFDNSACDDECKYFKAARKSATVIRALWDKKKPYAWAFDTIIPHATFDIVEAGEPWCQGIVFSLADVS